MDTRINKFISDSGHCSRREADRLIESGRVTINGTTAQMGSRVGESDIVKVNGKAIKTDVRRVYIALNKPVGIVSTTDPGERNNIADFVNFPMRVFNIGRLDKPSEGLILLTNDGNIVNKILRAENNHEKEYEVTVDKPITTSFLKSMASGVPILGTVTKRCKLTQVDRFQFKITLTQGLNRQIRRMCEHLGYEVIKLKRLRIMNISLDGLQSGHWRMLSDREMRELNRNLEGSEMVDTISSKARTDQRSEQRTNPRSDKHQDQRTSQRADQRTNPRSDQRPASKTQPKRQAKGGSKETPSAPVPQRGVGSRPSARGVKPFAKPSSKRTKRGGR